MKVRNIHGRPALWKGNKDYHAWKRRTKSAKRVAARRYADVMEACRAYMRPVYTRSAETAPIGEMG